MWLQTLDRNWNMWIPGFGSEDLRPYKKLPSTEAHRQVWSNSHFITGGTNDIRKSSLCLTFVLFDGFLTLIYKWIPSQTPPQWIVWEKLNPF